MKTTYPLKRYTPLPRGCKLNRVSKKRARLSRARTACNKAVAARSGGWCELKIGGICQGRGTTVHEKLSRARGGSIIDPANCLHACDGCHRWVHEHPEQAGKMGFLKSRRKDS